MPVRVYTLLDVLKQLNSDSTQYIAPNPNEIVSQFMSGAETLIAQPVWTDNDYTPYPFLVADQDGPTGFWLMNDNVGSTSAFDSMPYLTGGKHPGAVTGTVTFGTGGIFASGNGALFDGSTGYADAGTGSFDPSGTKTFTIEAWIQPKTVDANFRRACGMEATVNHGVTLYWQSTAGWGFLRGDSSAGNDVATGGTPTVNAWAHVVGTYDGTNMRLYVNGSLVTTTASSRSVDTASATFRMGGTQASLNGNAVLQFVAVYPIALSATQVLNHYNWGVASNAIGGFTYAGSPNFVGDPSFEDVDLSRWSCQDSQAGDSHALVSSDRHYGAQCLMFTRPSTNSGTWSVGEPASNPVTGLQTVGGTPRLFPVTPGQVYFLSVWIKTSAGVVATHFKVTWFNSSGVGISNYQPTPGGGIMGYTGWTNYTGTWTVPAGAAFANVDCMAGYWDGVHGLNAQSWFDDVYIGLNPPTLSNGFADKYGKMVYPNPPKRGNNLWGSAVWGSFTWG